MASYSLTRMMPMHWNQAMDITNKSERQATGKQQHHGSMEECYVDKIKNSGVFSMTLQ
jgi:hypothetical protein